MGKPPLVIGITGGIGSGKSTFANLLREKGYAVYDSDMEARRLQNNHPVVKMRIQELFGEKIYDENGLNRKALAEIVFRDKKLLTQLEHIVHPVVWDDFHDWVSAQTDEKLLFFEAAILFENGWYRDVDKIIVITASEQVRIGRVMARDGVTAEQVRSRMVNQWPEEDKIARADFVIHSDDHFPLEGKVQNIIQQLIKVGRR